MYLDEIKRGLRAEIKKRENEQYATFQCNVRQMCKDVLAKLEEQESEIAEKDKVIAELKRQIEFLKVTHSSCGECNKCADGMGKVFDEDLKELKAQKMQLEDDVALLRRNSAELRDKCQMHDFFWEGCGFAKRGFKNTIAVSEAFDKLEAENAELKSKLDIYKRGFAEDDKIIAYLYAELCHHKYKRCLAMAKWCYSMDCKMLDEAADNGTYFKESWCWKRALWYGKWKRKWLELAEKFKEGT